MSLRVRGGITRESLFPDLEGLSAELNYSRSGGIRISRSSGIPLEWLSPAKREEAERLLASKGDRKGKGKGDDDEDEKNKPQDEQKG